MKKIKERQKLKVVSIGGGTGLSVLLRGLKQYPIDITAIVTVTDDGGSSGEIRNKMQMPPPGDIRNVMAALSDVEPLIEQLFQYRFDKNSGSVEGHPVGNLMLAALTDIMNDFGHAVKELSKVLNIKGTVLPTTKFAPVLHAIMSDDSEIIGESNITADQRAIKRVFVTPKYLRPMDEVIQAIEEADLITLGPGSLFTSVLPNVVVKDMAKLIANSKAKKLYICNIMTQQGETDGYSASDHARVLNDHLGGHILDAIIINSEPFKEEIKQKYEANHQEIVEADYQKLEDMGITVLTDSQVFIKQKDGTIKHNETIVSSLIYDYLLEEISTRIY